MTHRCIGLAALLLAAAAARADTLVHVAGGDGPDGSPAAQAQLVQPFGVDFAPDGTVYVVEMARGERLRAIDGMGRLVTVAGAGRRGFSGDGGPAKAATFNGMHGLAVGPDANVYLADTWNNCVRVYDSKAGTVGPFAGKPVPLDAGVRQPPPNAELGGVYCIAFEPTGRFLYVCDLDRRRVFKADRTTRSLTPVAGNGQKGAPKEGAAAVDQPLVDPRAVAADAKGNVYVLERSANCLRVVGADGKVRTVAGDGKKGSAGVGGPALQLQMNGPKHLCIDRDGSVLIADTENHRVLRYVPGREVVEAVAGSGKKGRAGIDGDPKLAELSQPHGVAVRPKTGEIYISDAGNDRVVKIVRE